MVNAQKWLESQEQYNTKEKREKIERLDIEEKNLEGHLDLKDFINLKELNCYNNQLTNLKFADEKKITKLDIRDNYFAQKDLSFLKPLKNMSNLKELSIINTDISGGLEYLPKNLEKIKCGTTFGREKDYKCSEICEELKNYELGFTLQDSYFCAWLKNTKQLTPEQAKVNKQQLKGEFNEYWNEVSKITQQWLDQNYPDKKTRTIYLNQQLEGILDCSGYAQTWLDQKYPKDGTCVRENERNYSPHVNNFECHDNCLTNLNVNNCRKLKRIECCNNQLTTLDLSNLEELETLEYYDNYLTQMPYLPNPKKLTIGNTDKNKTNQGIYNKIEGSLEPLKDLSKDFDYDTKLRPDCKLTEMVPLLKSRESQKKIGKFIQQSQVEKIPYEQFTYINYLAQEVNESQNTEFTQQLKDAESYNQTLPDEIKYPKHELHMGAVQYSKLINTKQITRSLNATENLKLDINDYLSELYLQEEPTSPTKIEEEQIIELKKQLEDAQQQAKY
nr:12351_t:CDS:2 [Entrophospora candida]